MRASLALLLPAAVSASPFIDPKLANELFCKVNNIVIGALSKDAAATKFCSSYLSIRTSTILTTSTSTPVSVTATATLTQTIGAITVTRPFTDTVTATGTITVTSTQAILTNTVSTSTSTQTCLTSAYFGPNGAVLPKRQAAAIAKPTAIPKDWSKQYISTACSCLAIPTPSTTSTIVQTLTTGTITITQTTGIIVTQTTDSTSTVTATSFVTLSTSTVLTSTVTSTTVVSTLQTSGAQVRTYEHSYEAEGFNENGFTSSYFKSASPLLTFEYNSLVFATDNYPYSSTYLQLGSNGFDAAHAGVLIQGFFLAKESGTYGFSSSDADVDNWGYMWTGSVAYSAWNDDNTAFKSYGPGVATPGQTFVTMRAGDAVPFTYLWANGGGPGQSLVRIRTPSGQVTTDWASYLVKPCDASVFP